MAYTKSVSVIVDEDRHDSSLDDGTSESLWLECNFKHILVNSLKWLVSDDFAVIGS